MYGPEFSFPPKPRKQTSTPGLRRDDITGLHSQLPPWQIWYLSRLYWIRQRWPKKGFLQRWALRFSYILHNLLFASTRQMDMQHHLGRELFIGGTGLNNPPSLLLFFFFFRFS